MAKTTVRQVVRKRLHIPAYRLWILRHLKPTFKVKVYSPKVFAAVKEEVFFSAESTVTRTLPRQASRWVVPYLQVEISNFIYQKDHNEVRSYLDELPNQWIGNGDPMEFPPILRDFTSLGTFLEICYGPYLPSIPCLWPNKRQRHGSQKAVPNFNSKPTPKAEAGCWISVWQSWRRL